MIQETGGADDRVAPLVQDTGATSYGVYLAAAERPGCPVCRLVGLYG